MNYLLPAQAGAQQAMLAVYIAVARWYVAPGLATRNRADALIALLWAHVFRYVALHVFSAQRDGFPISDGGAIDIVIGMSSERSSRWLRSCCCASVPGSGSRSAGCWSPKPSPTRFSTFAAAWRSTS